MSIEQSPETETEPQALRCKHHPGTETYLRCGKCDEPICAKCVVITPVGARCRECAQLKRLPTYMLSPGDYVRAIVAMLVAAVGGGLIAGYLSAVIPFGGILIPIGLGFVIGEAVALATNRKRATPLKVIAAIGVLLAFPLQPLAHSPGSYGLASIFSLMMATYGVLFINPFGLLGLVLAIVVAVKRF